MGFDIDQDVVIASLSLGAVLTLGPALLIDVFVHQGNWINPLTGTLMGGSIWPRPFRSLYLSVNHRPQRLQAFGFWGKLIGGPMALGAVS